ncbi:MAG: PQQ-binding-like beta-propeller repeat protein [Candidatus Promineifilaceae bacterium]|nr:PQQ-binding-like beta-propeller repeat protein [Candidatus Promineifilaceae bacterium]
MTKLHGRRHQRLALFVLIAASFALAACGTDLAGGNWPGVSAHDGVVYVAYGPQVLAVTVGEETPLWTFPTTDSAAAPIFAPPSVEDGRIVFGDYGTQGGFLSPSTEVTIYSLQVSEEGVPAVRWAESAVAQDKIVAPALQAGDRVFVGTGDNHVLALDAASGDLLWDFETGHSVWGQPIYQDGVVYVTSLDKQVHALDAADGREIWNQQLGGAVSDRAALNSGLVYVGAFDGTLYALDRDSGEVQWTAEAERSIWAAPVYSDGTVFFVDAGGELRAVSAASGELRWSKSLGNFVVATPLVLGDTLFVATSGDPDVEEEAREGQLFAFDTGDGEDKWPEPVTAAAPISTNPIEVSGGVLITTLTEDEPLTLRLYDPEDGSLLWDFEPPSSAEQG